MVRAQKRRRPVQNHAYQDRDDPINIFQRRGFRQRGPAGGPMRRRKPIKFKGNPRDWLASTNFIPFQRTGYRKTAPMPRGLRVLKDDANVEASKRNKAFFTPVTSLLNRIDKNIDLHGTSSVFALQLIANDIARVPGFMQGAGQDIGRIAAVLGRIQGLLRPDNAPNEGEAKEREAVAERVGLMRRGQRPDDAEAKAFGPEPRPGGPRADAPEILVPPGLGRPPPPPAGAQNQAVHAGVLQRGIAQRDALRAAALDRFMQRMQAGLTPRQSAAPPASGQQRGEPLIPPVLQGPPAPPVDAGRRAPEVGPGPPPFPGAAAPGGLPPPNPFAAAGVLDQIQAPPPLRVAPPQPQRAAASRNDLLAAIRRRPALLNRRDPTGHAAPEVGVFDKALAKAKQFVRTVTTLTNGDDEDDWTDSDDDRAEVAMKNQGVKPRPTTEADFETENKSLETGGAVIPTKPSDRRSATNVSGIQSNRGPKLHSLPGIGEQPFPPAPPQEAVPDPLGPPGVDPEEKVADIDAMDESEARDSVPVEDASIVNLPEYSRANEEEKDTMRDNNNRLRPFIPNPGISKRNRTERFAALMIFTNGRTTIDAGFFDQGAADASARNTIFCLWLVSVMDRDNPTSNLRDSFGTIIDAPTVVRIMRDDPNVRLNLITRQLEASALDFRQEMATRRGAIGDSGDDDDDMDTDESDFGAF